MPQVWNTSIGPLTASENSFYSNEFSAVASRLNNLSELDVRNAVYDAMKTNRTEIYQGWPRSLEEQCVELYEMELNDLLHQVLHKKWGGVLETFMLEEIFGLIITVWRLTPGGPEDELEVYLTTERENDSTKIPIHLLMHETGNGRRVSLSHLKVKAVRERNFRERQAEKVERRAHQEQREAHKSAEKEAMAIRKETLKDLRASARKRRSKDRRSHRAEREDEANVQRKSQAEEQKNARLKRFNRRQMLKEIMMSSNKNSDDELNNGEEEEECTRDELRKLREQTVFVQSKLASPRKHRKIEQNHTAQQTKKLEEQERRVNRAQEIPKEPVEERFIETRTKKKARQEDTSPEKTKKLNDQTKDAILLVEEEDIEKNPTKQSKKTKKHDPISGEQKPDKMPIHNQAVLERPPSKMRIPAPIEWRVLQETMKTCNEEMRQVQHVCLCCDAWTEARHIKEYDATSRDNATLIEQLSNRTKNPMKRLSMINEQIKKIQAKGLTPKEGQEKIELKTKSSYTWMEDVPPELIEFYDITPGLLPELRPIFSDCLLSKKGLIYETNQKFSHRFRLCTSCRNGLKDYQHADKPTITTKTAATLEKHLNLYKPPRLAIANGLWIGEAPSDLDWKNLTPAERTVLQLCTIFVNVTLFQPSSVAHRRIHTSTSIFASGNTVIAETLPWLPPDQESSFRLLYSSTNSRNNHKIPPKIHHLMSKMCEIRPQAVRITYKWLVKHNTVYREALQGKEFDEDALEQITSIYRTDGSVISIVSERGQLEKSTCTNPTSENILQAEHDHETDMNITTKTTTTDDDPFATNTLSEDDELTLISVGTNYYAGSEADSNVVLNHVLKHLRAEDAGHHVPIKAIEVKSGNIHAFGNQKNVMEKVFFDLLPYGTGGLTQERSVHLTPMEYFAHLLRLAGKQFQDHAQFTAFAFEVYRFDSVHKRIFSVNTPSAINFMFITEKQLTLALERTMKLNQRGNSETSAQVQKLEQTANYILADAYGSDASKAVDRNQLMGLTATIGQPHLFLTFNPSNKKSIIFHEKINNVEFQKILISTEKIMQDFNDSIQGQVHAFSESIYFFAHHFLQYDLEKTQPAEFDYSKPGPFGPVKAFFAVPETTGQGALHLHVLLWLQNAPETPSQLRKHCQEEGHTKTVNALIAFFESICTSSFEGIFAQDALVGSECPNCQDHCGSGTLTTLPGQTTSSPLPPRYQLSKSLKDDPPVRVICNSETCVWRGTGRMVIEARIRKILQKNNLMKEDELLGDVLRSRTHLQKIGFTSLDDIEQVEVQQALLAILFLDVQMHEEKHFHTCAKKGALCRLRMPRDTSATATLKNHFLPKAPFCSEYLNPCMEALTRTFQCNTDIQCLLTDSDSGSTINFYIEKYLTKDQDRFATRDKILQMKAFVHHYLETRQVKVEEINSNEKDDKVLYQKAQIRTGKNLATTVTNALNHNDEIDLTSAQLALQLKGKRYWCSHQMIALNTAKPFAKWFPNSAPHDSVSETFERDPQSYPVQYLKKDDHAIYTCRPVELENLSWHEFLLNYHMVKKSEDEDAPTFELLPEHPLSKTHSVSARMGNYAIYTVGPTLPNHFDFDPNPCIYLKDYVPPTSDDSTQALVNKETINNENLNQTSLECEEENNDLEPQNDNEHDDHSRAKKQETFAFLVHLQFVPHRNLEDIVSKNNTEPNAWWTKFKQNATNLSDRDSLTLLQTLEQKPKPASRTALAKEIQAKTKAAEQDLKQTQQATKGKTLKIITTCYDEPDVLDDLRGPNSNGITTRELAETYEEEQRTAKAKLLFPHIFKFHKNENEHESIATININTNIFTDIIVSAETIREDVVSLANEANQGITSTRTITGLIDRSQFTTESATHTLPEIPMKITINPMFPRSETLDTLSSLEDFQVAFDLNFTQRRVFLHLARKLLVRIHGSTNILNYDAELQEDTVKVDENPSAPSRIILGGEGGTGKTFIMKALITLARIHGHPESVLLTSEFGSTAANIGGPTIAHLIGMHPARKEDGRKGAFNLSAHTERLAKVELLIVDEYALCNKKHLLLLHQSLNIAKNKQAKGIFGDVNVVLCGDVFQLPPVQAHALHTIDNSPMTNLFLEHFTTVFILTEQRRFADDEDLKACSRSYRSKKWTKKNVDFLNSKVVKNPTKELSWHKTIMLVSTRAANRVNMQYYTTSKLQSPGANHKIIAWNAIITNINNNPTNIDDQNLGHLINDAIYDRNIGISRPIEGFSAYHIGELVTITENQCVDAQVANGVFGYIERLEFPNGTTSQVVQNKNDTAYTLMSSPPAYVVVKLLTPAPINLGQGFGTELRPVWLSNRKQILHINGAKLTCDVTNIPIMPAAVSTVHSIQGKTIPKDYSVIITDLFASWHAFPVHGFYVAITRAQTSKQLHFLRKEFTHAEVNKLVPPDDILQEHTRIWIAAEKTARTLAPESVIPTRRDGKPRIAQFLVDDTVGIIPPERHSELPQILQVLHSFGHHVQPTWRPDHKLLRDIYRLPLFHLNDMTVDVFDEHVVVRPQDLKEVKTIWHTTFEEFFNNKNLVKLLDTKILKSRQNELRKTLSTVRQNNALIIVLPNPENSKEEFQEEYEENDKKKTWKLKAAVEQNEEETSVWKAHSKHNEWYYKVTNEEVTTPVKFNRPSTKTSKSTFRQDCDYISTINPTYLHYQAKFL